MQFELVSPERKLASLKVKSVTVPSSEGDFTAYANYEPTVAALRPGIVIADGEDGTKREFVVSGGFAEIGENGISILAERALERALASAEFFAHSIGEIESKLEKLQGDHPVEKMRLEALLADVRFAQASMG